jgi:hypothetical protein
MLGWTKIGFFAEYRYLCEDVNVSKVRNPMRRFMLLLMSVMVLTLSGCKNIKDITVTSVEVEAIAPEGLKGLNVYLAVGIDNPAMQISFEDINGALKHSGKVIGRMAMDPFVLQARSAEIYHLKAFVTIGEDATLRDLLLLTNVDRLNECMVDVSAKPRLKSGLGAPVTIKDIPLKKLLE